LVLFIPPVFCSSTAAMAKRVNAVYVNVNWNVSEGWRSAWISRAPSRGWRR
jgi:hypothetical protein